jgi:hypothetical protein
MPLTMIFCQLELDPVLVVWMYLDDLALCTTMKAVVLGGGVRGGVGGLGGTTPHLKLVFIHQDIL